MIRKLIVLILLFTATEVTKGQDNFVFKANIDPVSTEGFYKIQLLPNLVSKSNTSLSDLRIIDGNKKFVPYIRLQNLPSRKDDFIEFPIVSNSKADSINTIVLENTKSLLLQSLWLKAKNTAVYRNADLLGSDDGKQWFAIQEGIPLRQSSSSNTDSYLQSLSFPASNYHYFKININNGSKDAVKILSVGIYASTQVNVQYSAIPAPAIKRVDSVDKSTYLQLNFQQQFLINKLSITISAPKFYRRKILITEVIGKQKNLIGEAVLQSGTTADILFSAKTNQLELQIINGDNPPLQIGAIQAAQAKEYIVAYLEPKVSYQLLFGNTKALEPDYDLSFFADSSKKVLAEIQHSNPEKNPLHKVAVVTKSADYTIWVWVAILAILGLLSLLSWKMLSELKARK